MPDLTIWWTGGQLGFVHVSSPLYVAAPLTLVSTWDGDELSLVQMHHQLRAARRVDVAAGTAALDEALAPLAGAGIEAAGLGLHRVLHAGARAETLAAALLGKGVRVRLHPGGRLGVAPPLDEAEEHARALGAALHAVL